jgi:hypothetical protein
MLTRLVIIRGSFGFYNARPKPLHYTCTDSIKVERIIIGGILQNKSSLRIKQGS